VELSASIRERVQNIVIVMMENRSFDHMLGYLGKSQWRLGDPGDPDSMVDGLTDKEYSVEWDEEPYSTYPLGTTKWEEPDHRDPPHSGKMVGWQVVDPARYIWSYKMKQPGAKPGGVMGYLTKPEVPVYDFLARNYCVCDQWFCSVPGATWPNRMFAVAGTAGGETDIPETVLEGLWGKHTFFRELDARGVSWRWYSSDPSLLRAFDPEYRTDKTEHDRFAYFNECSKRQRRNFLRDCQEGKLPQVSWVDPNFFKFPLGLDGPAEANDDHPPHDVMLGQKFINTVYEALRNNEKQWNQTLLIVTYDEHGGFYDHVTPDPPLGPRVPALLVSPWVTPGRPLHTPLEHTSIIKTVLRRFADDRAIEVMGPRVYCANDVWDAITETEPRSGGPVTEPGLAAVGPKDFESIELKWPASTLGRIVEIVDKHSRRTEGSRADLVDLQEDLILLYEEMRRVVPREIGRPFSRIARAVPAGLRRLVSRLVNPFLARRKIPDRQP